jgi:hypothetical protein
VLSSTFTPSTRSTMQQDNRKCVVGNPGHSNLKRHTRRASLVIYLMVRQPTMWRNFDTKSRIVLDPSKRDARVRFHHDAVGKTKNGHPPAAAGCRTS